MKKFVSALCALLITGSFAFSQPLLRQDNSDDNKKALEKGYLTWNAQSPVFLNLEKAFKNYEATLNKKLFIAQNESKTGSVYVGQAIFPLASISDLEHKMVKGFAQAKYLVPAGYSLSKNYNTAKYPYTGEAYASSLSDNWVVVRLNKEEVSFALNHNVTLTKASQKAVLLSMPVEEVTPDGFHTGYIKKPTAAELSQCLSSEGKVMTASPNGFPANDKGLDRILNFFYSPKYYRLEVVFHSKYNGFDCSTPSLSAKGISCNIPVPAAEIRQGSSVIQFYIVPDIDALAKDFKFVQQAITAAAKK